MFPLNSVLFPGMILPLHIFEERYKLMIGRCIAQNEPFGVVLIRSGQEVGGTATPYSVGTTAHITRVDQLSDGRMNIECVGYERFNIVEILSADPYLVGRIEPIPLIEDDEPDVPELTQKLRSLLPQYLGLLSQVTSKALPVEDIPKQSDALAYWIAILAPLENSAKQTLLECVRLSDLLAAEIGLIRKETMLLASFLRLAMQKRSGTSGFSSN